MDNKEKLKEAKRLYELANADQKYVLESLFPELAGGADEEIKNAMINFFKSERKEGDAVLHYGVNIESMISWLEKQGGQKSIEWDEYDEMYVSALIAIIGKDGATGKNLRDELTGWLNCLKGRFKKDKL